eukprot:TRINITY_DN58037_c0_g1_i1.p1 TRINITY_DN58037_c0_g1~~TRINITY_DN58037_c0_g1_i1.p1  ORF type:complete len:336 (+),score=54.56 TRINITY_DN58037_c0_g1_i1:50-1057(+)
MASFDFSSAHSAPVHDVQFDPFGKFIATCSSDTTVRIFAVPSELADDKLPVCTAILSGHEGPVWQVSWPPATFGSMLASASFDHSIIVWQEGHGGAWHRIHTATQHSASVNAVAWAPAPHGLLFAAASSDGRLSLTRWDSVATAWQSDLSPSAHRLGAMCVAWRMPPEDAGSDAAVPPYTIASGGCDGAVVVWRVTDSEGAAVPQTGPLPSLSWTRQSVIPAGTERAWVRSLAFPPTAWAAVLAVGANDGFLRLYEEVAEDTATADSPTNSKEATEGRTTWTLAAEASGGGAVQRLAWDALGSSVVGAAAGGKTAALRQDAEGVWAVETSSLDTA